MASMMGEGGRNTPSHVITLVFEVSCKVERRHPPAAEFALDDDGAEIPCEIVALDLVALLAHVAVGHERQRQPARAERVQHGARLRRPRAVETVDVSEFAKAEGCVTCLSLLLAD